MGKIKTDELEERVSNAGITVNSTLKGAALQDYSEIHQDISSSATLAIDLDDGNTGSVTLGTNVTNINFTNVPTAGVSTFTLIVTQDGTGSRTMAIDAVSVNSATAATAKTPAAAGLTLTTTAAGIDILTFIFKDAGTPFLTTQLAFG
jgi:hypothetical protein